MECLNCGLPSIGSRMPGQRWSRWIYQRCWPCVKQFYGTVHTEAERVKVLLVDFFKALEARG